MYYSGYQNATVVAVYHVGVTVVCTVVCNVCPCTVQLHYAAPYPAPAPAAGGNFYDAARGARLGSVARWAFRGLRIVSAIALLGGGIGLYVIKLAFIMHLLVYFPP
jgi:hypothetical protein